MTFEQHLHAHQQLSEVEGLHHVVVGPHVEALQLVVGRAQGGEHQDGDALVGLAYRPAELKAVQLGQDDV